MGIPGVTDIGYVYRSSNVEEERKRLERIDDLEQLAYKHETEMDKAMKEADEATYMKAKKNLTETLEKIRMHESYIDFLVNGYSKLPYTERIVKNE